MSYRFPRVCAVALAMVGWGRLVCLAFLGLAVRWAVSQQLVSIPSGWAMQAFWLVLLAGRLFGGSLGVACLTLSQAVRVFLVQRDLLEQFVGLPQASGTLPDTLRDHFALPDLWRREAS